MTDLQDEYGPAVVENDLDLVTVVIPARNEEGDLPTCLDSVLEQDYPSLQVVVVDGASTDRTRDIIEDYQTRDPRVSLVRNDHANIPMSLNLGLEAARGQWLVRVDAHSTIPKGYVRQAVTLLREGSWGGVGGRKEAVGGGVRGRAIAAALGSKFGVGNSLYHYGTRAQETDHVPFGAYRTHVARSLGGWNESLLANEDFEFDLRLRTAGYRLLFDPTLSIAWSSRQSLGSLFSQYFRYGRSKVPVARLHPSSLRLRHLAPPALVIYVAAAAGTALLKSPKGGAVMVAPYVLGLAGGSAVAGRNLAPLERAVLPLAFATMHTAWGLGFWRGVIDSLPSKSSGGSAPVRG